MPPHLEPLKARIVLLGQSSVGKSSLINRCVRGEFDDCRETTIGAAFLAHTFNIDGQTLNLDIWDTAGQER